MQSPPYNDKLSWTKTEIFVIRFFSNLWKKIRDPVRSGKPGFSIIRSGLKKSDTFGF